MPYDAKRNETRFERGASSRRLNSLVERPQNDMPLADATEKALLQSIEAGRLVIVCGAGLSIAGRSRGPSAKRIAEVCFDRARQVDPQLNADLRENLNLLAEHFAANQGLQSYFIPCLVPWDEFVGEPNDGHIAIADFALCKVVEAAITTNYDFLVEEAARSFHVDFQSTIDGPGAAVQHGHANYIKLHGCAVRNRLETIWAPSQLQTDQQLADRLSGLKSWLRSHLHEKDYIFVGFWSDWRYLNAILEETLSTITRTKVFVVDPAPDAELQAKAPALWALLNDPQTVFEHIDMSGEELLDGLRAAFSRMYLRKVFALGEIQFREAIYRNVPLPEIASSQRSSDLHDARCDAEGIPRSRAARLKAPTANVSQYAFAHLLLAHAGAEAIGADYQIKGQRIRVINSAGRFIAEVRGHFADDPVPIPGADVILCAGGENVGAPNNIVREGATSSIVRPLAGGSWVDLQAARALLEI
jgi:hypothetical protein